LASLFGTQSSTLNQGEAPREVPEVVTGAQSQPASGLKSLITQASNDFSDYQRLTSEGKLSDAGQKLDDLKRTIDQLNALPK